MDNKQEYYSSLLLNKTEEYAFKFGKENNVWVCICKRDGKVHLYPDDRRYGRLDIEIDNNIVTKVTFVERIKLK